MNPIPSPLHQLLAGCFLAFGLSVPSMAQVTDDRGIADLVREQCPAADILSIERSGSGLVEVEYLCGAELVEAGISNGRVTYLEREVRPDAAVMERIEKAIAKHHAGWALDEIGLVAAVDTSFLKVEIMLDGVEQNLYFTTTGRKYKPTALLVSDKWSLFSLRGQDLPRLGYDLLDPDTVHELPDLLREVSGIAMADDGSVLCVQDELGAVFTYDLRDGRITDVLRFTDVGDFEDIAVHGDTIVVLRSDGHLVYLDRRGRTVIHEQMPALASLNQEGLYLDAATGEAHIVSKDAPVTGPAEDRQVQRIGRNGRVQVVRTLSSAGVAQALARISPAMAGPGLHFQPSAAGIHPITQALYVLSASDRLLVVFDGTETAVHPLPAEVYFKPEGLAFLTNGDLLISSEGDKKGMAKGCIMRFAYNALR
ncbi:MAG: hypothetical protein QY325_09200 [Flavobacteriales bacterium]|nr:MAG: hypothetical protein QY325_09200 [Flavobacteriales bacterium]